MRAAPRLTKQEGVVVGLFVFFLLLMGKILERVGR